jgi:hypothetical protein
MHSFSRFQRLFFTAALLPLFLGSFSFPRAAQAQENVSLAGQWRFARDEAKKGLAAKWYAGELKPSSDAPAEIALPGTTDEAKAGHPNTQPATFIGLYEPNSYEGVAWYQREIEIPDGWKGKHVTLFLERCHWTNQVWIDDKDYGVQDSMIAPQVYDLGTDLAPGKHRLTVRVDNTTKYRIGGYASIIYPYTQTDWNGIVGRIELQASDPVALSDVQVYPDIDRKLIKVEAHVANLTGAAAGGKLQLAVADADGKPHGAPVTAAYASSEKEATVTAEVPMGDDFKLWDEFTPNLYTLKASLATADGANKSEQSVTFGMRKFEIQGTQFVMNGRPLYLRGTLEDAIFPLTGYPPTTVEPWRRIFKIEKSYGLNYLRFHSWIPPEAAFAAADLEGIVLQPEGPNANVDLGGDRPDAPPRDKWIGEELMRSVRFYGNHPSFGMLAMGNEAGGTTPLGHKMLIDWIDALKKADPRHLYTSETMGEVVANQQWIETQDGRGVQGPGTLNDLHEVVAKFTYPVIGHEIGQWAVFPNLEEAKKYTGVVNAKNFDLVRDKLALHGMVDEAPQFYQSSGHLSALLYKEEIEVLLRTAGYGGFSLLDLHDYPGQGMALVGMLDPFWDAKGFVTPEAFKDHTGPVVPLLRFPKRVYTVNESFAAKAQVAQFGPVDLPQAHGTWTIKTDAGDEIASGTLPQASLPTGKLSDFGAISAALGKAPAPCKAVVTVALDDTPYKNSWDIWIYPVPSLVTPPSGVVVTEEWPEARKALEDGKKVAFFPKKLDPYKSRRGSFVTMFWSPIWFHLDPSTMGILLDPKHPLFAQFPTEFFGNWQWYNLLEKSRTMILNEAPNEFRPLVQVIDNFSRGDKMANVLEVTSGNGQLLACSLPVFGSKEPEAVQFLRSAYAYVGSSDFQPKQSLDLETLDKIFAITPPHLKTLDVKVLKVDSEQPGYAAANVLDGDPMTFWHTRYAPKEDPFPHSIILDLGKEMTVKALNYLPRQDSESGRIKIYRVYAGNSPDDMGEPLMQGEFLDTDKQQTAEFPKPVSARYIKLESLSGVLNQPYTAIGELDLVLDGQP